MPPHSSTVRGTLSNPKTQEAKARNESTPGQQNRTQLADSASLEVEKNDSNPRPDPHVADSSESGSGSGGNASSSSSKDLPHSKKVRGTLGNSDGKEVEKTQLGDPASLTSERSGTEMDGGTERGVGRGSKL